MIERSRLAGRCMECLEHVWPRKNIKATQRNQNHPRSALEPPIPTPKTIEEQLSKHRSTSSSSKNHQNHPRSAQATIEPTEPPQAPLKPHQIPLSVTNTNPDLPSIYPEPHRTSITGKKKSPISMDSIIKDHKRLPKPKQELDLSSSSLHLMGDQVH